MDGNANINDDNAPGKLTDNVNIGDRKPVGTVNASAGAIDPALARTAAGTATAPGTTDPGTTKRPRGRPPGSGKKAAGAVSDADIEIHIDKDGNIKPAKAASKPTPININGIEKILLSLHEIAAATVSIPELKLEPKEAKELSDAIAAVGEQYLIVLSPKTAAWIDLGRVLGCVYGPRAMAVYITAQAKKPPPVANPNNGASHKAPPGAVPAKMAFDPTSIKLN